MRMLCIKPCVITMQGFICFMSNIKIIYNMKACSYIVEMKNSSNFAIANKNPIKYKQK